MRIFIFPVLITVLLIACKKDNYSSKPDILAGYAVGTKNGKPWIGYCSKVDLNAKDSSQIRLDVYSFYDTLNWYPVEGLEIGGLSPCICKTEGFRLEVGPNGLITSKKWLDYAILEFDVIKGLFGPDTLANNYLEFTHIDTITGVCAGKFDITVINAHPNPDYPDSIIRFENVTFTTALK